MKMNSLVSESKREFTVENFNEILECSLPNRAVIIIDKQYLLSIAFGYAHYSKPRENINPNGYERFEIALISRSGGIIQPRYVAGLRTREWCARFNLGWQPVAAYVPRETIVRIVNDVVARKNFGG